jgi:DNA-directed RNA polymerase specialized sigma24 family protein
LSGNQRADARGNTAPIAPDTTRVHRSLSRCDAVEKFQEFLAESHFFASGNWARAMFRALASGYVIEIRRRFCGGTAKKIHETAPQRGSATSCYAGKRSGRTMGPKREDITGLLNRWLRGDNRAFEQMYEAMEPYLKDIVRRHVLGVRSVDLTQPTAVLQEVLLRLCHRVEQARNEAKPETDGDRRLWEHRNHFISHVVMTARSIRLDALRKHFTEKHGAGTTHFSIQEGDVADRAGLRLVIGHIALDELSAQRPELHKAFVLKKEFGFTWDEVAETLQVTVSRAREYVTKAEEALRATVAATQPETAFRFIRNLDQQE